MSESGGRAPLLWRRGQRTESHLALDGGLEVELGQEDALLRRTDQLRGFVEVVHHIENVEAPCRLVPFGVLERKILLSHYQVVLRLLHMVSASW